METVEQQRPGQPSPQMSDGLNPSTSLLREILKQGQALMASVARRQQEIAAQLVEKELELQGLKRARSQLEHFYKQLDELQDTLQLDELQDTLMQAPSSKRHDRRSDDDSAPMADSGAGEAAGDVRRLQEEFHRVKGEIHELEQQKQRQYDAGQGETAAARPGRLGHEWQGERERAQGQNAKPSERVAELQHQLELTRGEAHLLQRGWDEWQNERHHLLTELEEARKQLKELEPRAERRLGEQNPLLTQTFEPVLGAGEIPSSDGRSNPEGQPAARIAGLDTLSAGQVQKSGVPGQDPVLARLVELRKEWQDTHRALTEEKSP